MIKTAMLVVSAMALALAALPALAAAEPGDPVLTFGSTGNHPFTAAGTGNAVLVGTNGENTVEVKCTSSAGSGQFEGATNNQETGSVKFTFKGCTTLGGLAKCTTKGEGEEAGKIETTTLPLHLKTVVHEGKHTPGVLITASSTELEHSNGEKGTHFATFVCGGIITVNVGGPSTKTTEDGTKHKAGVIGTITAPEEEVASNTATISFQKDAANPHHQTHQIVTGDEHSYNLWSNANGGETRTASETAEGTLTFEKGVEPKLSTTPTE